MSNSEGTPSAEELLGDIDFLIACLERIQVQNRLINDLENLAAQQAQVIATYADLALGGEER
ncbi:hypothetical protein [Actinomyces minihominis]|uniref:hypothetical protein n=1 Tax=Actinomyces minihominis TaxID=2002838 RepID=UPI000C085A8D|nr:hypothetical protein [Actinomyces minihominis]